MAALGSVARDRRAEVTRGRLAWGIVVGAVYVGVAFMAARGGRPFVPLYDGLAPPAPYRYVNPPPDLADENEQALAAVGTLELTDEGSGARTVSTADGQALVVFPEGAVPARQGENEIEVRVTPLDPGRLAPPPDGLVISGNAYRTTARYSRSRAAVELRTGMTIVLRYATHATVMLSLEGNTWRRMKTESAQASLQLFAESRTLGTFAPAGTPPASRAWIAYLAAALGVAAGAAGFLTGRRRMRRPGRRPRPSRRRRPGSRG